MKFIYYLLCILSMVANIIVVAMDQENKIILPPNYISEFIKIVNTYPTAQELGLHMRNLSQKHSMWNYLLKDEACCSSLIEQASRIKNIRPEFFAVFMGTDGALKWLRGHIVQKSEALGNLSGLLVDIAGWPNWKKNKNLNIDIARTILKAGASLDAVDNSGISQRLGSPAIVAAAAHGNEKYMSFLIQAGAQIDASSTIDGKTPLIEASFYGHVKMVRLLIKMGAVLDSVDSFGHNALYWAIKQRNPQIVKYLIKGGANIANCSQDEVLYIGKSLRSKMKKYKEKLTWS